MWADGTPAPQIRDLTLADLAPSFRCITVGRTTYVELPATWRERVADPDVAAAITTLIHEQGRAAPIYAEGYAEAMADHRLSEAGLRIPITAWDAAMRRVVGAAWAAADDDTIWRKARTLGWTP